MNRLGLRKYFYCILTKDDVKKVKPSSEIYLLSLSRLGLNNSEVIILEDSPNGISAAKSAQLFKIAIPNQTTKSFNFKIADIVLNSLSDISLFELIKKIEDFEKNNYYMQMINLSNTKILLLV